MSSAHQRDALRVVIIDDSDDIRDLLRLALKRDPRFDVVAEAADGAQGLATIREHRPDVALLDLSMPGTGGLEVLSQLTTDDDRPVVIVLSGFSSGAPEQTAMEQGAAGYLEKGLSLRELGSRIHELYEQASQR